MKKATEYRSHAEECRAMARRIGNADQGAQLMTMAETWEELAAEREKRIASQWRRPGTAADERLEPSSSWKPAADSGSAE